MWTNAPVIWLLRSPLHPLISKETLLLTYTGRKSGRSYAIPINYTAENGTVSAVSFRRRTWWRNIRGGALVTLRIRGQELSAVGLAVEDEQMVARWLADYLLRFPHRAGYFQVKLDASGQPRVEDLQTAARSRILVQFQIKNF